MFATPIVISHRPYEYNRPAQATSHKAHMPHYRTVFSLPCQLPLICLSTLSTCHLYHEARQRV